MKSKGKDRGKRKREMDAQSLRDLSHKDRLSRVKGEKKIEREEE